MYWRSEPFGYSSITMQSDSMSRNVSVKCSYPFAMCGWSIASRSFASFSIWPMGVSCLIGMILSATCFPVILSFAV